MHQNHFFCSRRYMRFALLGAAVLASGCSQQSKRMTPEDHAASLASFDMVWETVRDKHFDKDVNGLDWEAERDTFRPQVENAKTRGEYLRATNALIARLNQTHIGILPREAYEDEDAADKATDADDADGEGVKQAEADPITTGSKNGSLGMELRPVEGKALVFRVHEDSPADHAGVKPGWIVESVNDTNMADHIATFEPEQFAHATELMRMVHVISPLYGPTDSTADLVFRDLDDERVEMELTRAEPVGTAFTFGHMPKQTLQFEARRLPGNIGYIRFNFFFDPGRLMPQFRNAVREFADADGMIIDLRGNIGGIGALAMGMTGMFVTEKGTLGEFITRDSTLKFNVDPQPRAYTGPLAVLIDGCTVSTGEILAAGLHDVADARLFGEATAGAALPSAIIKLPNNDRFQYIMANYITTAGLQIEGSGVVPDEVVEPRIADWRSGDDPVVSAAIAWLQPELETMQVVSFK